MSRSSDDKQITVNKMNTVFGSKFLIVAIVKKNQVSETCSLDLYYSYWIKAAVINRSKLSETRLEYTVKIIIIVLSLWSQNVRNVHRFFMTLIGSAFDLNIPSSHQQVIYLHGF